MSSPIEVITVECAACGEVYEDWHRASVNLDLDDFDAAYVEACGTATCPACDHLVRLDVLVVEAGVFRDGLVG